MSIAAILARNELLKLRKRRAFWVTIGLFGLIASIGFGEEFVEALREGDGGYSLPRAWAEILGEPTQIALIFGSVALLLLVASEFSWRTARQNVIDGLTRGQWYWGKAIASGLVIVAFLGAYFAIGVGLALASTDFGAGDALIRIHHVEAIGGVSLSFAGYAALALLIATTVRSTGGAMAIWFFYVAFGEMLLRGGIGRLWEAAKPYLAYAPVAAFDGLRDYLMYDPAELARVSDRLKEAGRAAPEVGDPAALAIASTAWIVAFALAGYLAYRRRDL